MTFQNYNSVESLPSEKRLGKENSIICADLVDLFSVSFKFKISRAPNNSVKTNQRKEPFCTFLAIICRKV